MTNTSPAFSRDELEILDAAAVAGVKALELIAPAALWSLAAEMPHSAWPAA